MVRDVSTLLDMTEKDHQRCVASRFSRFCHSERSRGISNYFSMPRDYNFWVYIVTNEHDSVLYVGMTNDLARRIGEHRTGEIPSFAADYRCRKLVYYEHCTNVLDAIAREKQISRNGHEQRKSH